MADFFPLDTDARFAPVWWSLGVRAGEHGVTLTDDDQFVATYGWVQVDTPISNIRTAENTGPYNPLKSIGLRLSAADSGLTMGTTGRSGCCVTFHQKVRGFLPVMRHRGLTVTVADPDGLVAAIRRRQG